MQYADKRDVRTLEYQLSQLNQGNKPLEEYYSEVTKHLSLILNGLKAEGHSIEGVRALSEHSRQQALDVFIRGVGNDASRLLVMRRPKDLQEAYFFCKELQAVGPREGSFARSSPPNFTPNTRFYRPPSGPRFTSSYQGNVRASIGSGYGGSPNSNRFQGPRPAIKMESNRSGQSHRSDYRVPQSEGSGMKRTSYEYQNPFQRATKLYHMEPVLDHSTMPAEHGEDPSTDPYYNQIGAENAGMAPQDIMEERDDPEIGAEGPNFMTEASRASLLRIRGERWG